MPDFYAENPTTSRIGDTISHHLLRRRARDRALRVERAYWRMGETGRRYSVERAQRGPWRWRVVRVA